MFPFDNMHNYRNYNNIYNPWSSNIQGQSGIQLHTNLPWRPPLNVPVYHRAPYEARNAMKYFCLTCRGDKNIKIDNFVSLTSTQQMTFSDLIYFCYNISVKSIIGDHINVSKFCSNCITRLCEAYTFKQQVINCLNDTLLHNQNISVTNHNNANVENYPIFENTYTANGISESHFNDHTLGEIVTTNAYEECQNTTSNIVHTDVIDSVDTKDICLKTEPIDAQNICEPTEDVHSLNAFQLNNQDDSVLNQDTSDSQHYQTNEDTHAEDSSYLNDNSLAAKDATGLNERCQSSLSHIRLEDVIDYVDTKDICLKTEPIDAQNICEPTEDVHSLNEFRLNNQDDSVLNRDTSDSQYYQTSEDTHAEDSSYLNDKSPAAKDSTDLNERCQSPLSHIRVKDNLKYGKKLYIKIKPIEIQNISAKDMQIKKSLNIKVNNGNTKVKKYSHRIVSIPIKSTIDEPFKKPSHPKKVSLMKLFNLDKNDLTCKMCNKTFYYFKNLKTHMHEHFPKYACEVCNKKFATEGSLYAHSKIHKSTDPMICTICNKSFKNNQILRLHKANHSGVVFRMRCEICNVGFTYFDAKRRHMEKVHNKTPLLFKCKLCPSQYNRSTHLLSHIRQIHLQEKNHVCTECGRKFFSLSDLKHHMAVHDTTKKFQCDICHSRFKLKKGVRLHLWNVHAPNKTYECSICKSVYDNMNSLNRHRLNHKK